MTNKDYRNLSSQEQRDLVERYNAAIGQYVNNNSERIKREEDAYWNAPRQKVQKAVDKGKEAVSAMNEGRRSLMTKLSDMAESVIRKAKRLLSRLFG